MGSLDSFSVLGISLVDGTVGVTDMLYNGGSVLKLITFGKSFYMVPCFFRVKLHFTYFIRFVFEPFELGFPYLFFSSAWMRLYASCEAAEGWLRHLCWLWLRFRIRGCKVSLASSNHVGLWLGISVRVFSATEAMFLRGRSRFVLCRGLWHHGL